MTSDNGRIGFNIYTHWFVAQCPNDGEQIYYKLQIRTTKIIFVEHIKAATALIKVGIQEQIADSTNAAVNGGSISRFGMYAPPTAGQRASVIADRIEAHTSAPIWQRENQIEMTL